MKNVMKSVVLLAAIFFVATTTYAATVTLVKKVPAGGPGNFNYTYKYTCNNGKSGTLTVSSGNDNGAKALAELEAKELCGEN
ncbi:hypothetical protein [Cellvibrio sp. pealriver]|uniref:hypothetical protein n=1 Tax=Cellvibrio sp. pealriver TaxID=1622269 RepID=UPI00066FC419|nr:hypothetical protein [Cellvibrio sp. pealriver]